MTVVQLHTDEDWDDQDYSKVESELLPVSIFEDDYRGDSRGAWFWRVDHPALDACDCVIGPFASARDAYENLMQYHKLQSASPVDIPLRSSSFAEQVVRDRVEMAALDTTVGAVIAKQLDSPHPEARERAERAIRDHSYD